MTSLLVSDAECENATVGVGFEPTMTRRPYWFSRPAHSAALPPVPSHDGLGGNCNRLCLTLKIKPDRSLDLQLLTHQGHRDGLVDVHFGGGFQLLFQEGTTDQSISPEPDGRSLPSFLL